MRRCTTAGAALLRRTPVVYARRRPARATAAATVCQAACGGASARLDSPEPPSAQGSMPWTDMLRGSDGVAGNDCVNRLRYQRFDASVMLAPTQKGQQVQMTSGLMSAYNVPTNLKASCKRDSRRPCDAIPSMSGPILAACARWQIRAFGPSCAMQWVPTLSTTLRRWRRVFGWSWRRAACLGPATRCRSRAPRK